MVLPLTSTGSAAIDLVLDARHAGGRVRAVHGDVQGAAVEPRGRDGGVVARQDGVDADRLDLPGRLLAVAVGDARAERVHALAADGHVDGARAGTVAERASSTSSHSICVTPLPPVSVPDTLTSTDGVVTQPAGTVVVSTGAAESTCTM